MSSELEHSHDPTAIAERLAGGPRPSYLPDAVYGAIDGTVTTFAVVAGAIGANLSPRVVIVLGAANLFADGFSMAAGNFAATRADREQIAHLTEQERRHVDLDPEGETSEVREIYRAKGFGGDALETLTRLITSRHDVWIETMLAGEYGMMRSLRLPLHAAIATFLAFVAAGSIPLLPFVLALPHAGALATVATAIVFALIGSVKSRWTLRAWWSSGLETFAIGMGAAIVAYGVGFTIERLI